MRTCEKGRRERATDEQTKATNRSPQQKHLQEPAKTEAGKERPQTNKPIGKESRKTTAEDRSRKATAKEPPTKQRANATQPENIKGEKLNKGNARREPELLRAKDKRAPPDVGRKPVQQGRLAADPFSVPSQLRQHAQMGAAVALDETHWETVNPKNNCFDAPGQLSRTCCNCAKCYWQGASPQAAPKRLKKKAAAARRNATVSCTA